MAVVLRSVERQLEMERGGKHGATAKKGNVGDESLLCEENGEKGTRLASRQFATGNRHLPYNQKGGGVFAAAAGFGAGSGINPVGFPDK